MLKVDRFGQRGTMAQAAKLVMAMLVGPLLGIDRNLMPTSAVQRRRDEQRDQQPGKVANGEHDRLSIFDRPRRAKQYRPRIIVVASLKS